MLSSGDMVHLTRRARRRHRTHEWQTATCQLGRGVSASAKSASTAWRRSRLSKMGTLRRPEASLVPVARYPVNVRVRRRRPTTLPWCSSVSVSLLPCVADAGPCRGSSSPDSARGARLHIGGGEICAADRLGQDSAPRATSVVARTPNGGVVMHDNLL